MHRAHDPGIVPFRSETASNSNSQERPQTSSVSRSSLVHGTQANTNSDTWYESDVFLLDQVKEVLNKLKEGAIDDEIWGKIVIMERCKRVAKAYLRKTTVIIDGSEEEFDGKTLGFNHFENPARDEYVQEIRAKIADGVILRMDYQGNIKGMARGSTPVICQGWKDQRSTCISDRLVRLQGKLNHGVTEEEKAYKVFDMKKFKTYLERELVENTPDARMLLMKTCVRIALVKDGADMTRTPCWFAVVNLVALDMLKEKFPDILMTVVREPGTLTKTVTDPVDGIDTTTLTKIIAAAVTQANKELTHTNSTQNLSISPEQLAQIASTLRVAQNQPSPVRMPLTEQTTINKKDRKKKYHFSTSSLDSSGEDSGDHTTESSSKLRSRRWDTSKSAADSDTTTSERLSEINKRISRPIRPRIQDVLFTRSQSTTSDYDSNREAFDSSSWSSTQSRYKGRTSTSSSMISDHETPIIEQDVVKNQDNEFTMPRCESPCEPSASQHSISTTQLTNERNVTTPVFNDHLPPSPEVPVTSPVESPEPDGITPWKPKLIWKEVPNDGNSSTPPPLPDTPLPIGNNNRMSSVLNETYPELRQLPKAIHPRAGETMEVFFGRAASRADHRSQQRSPLVNELRQVLEQRSSALRISRNHSQPAGAVHNLRQFAAARSIRDRGYHHQQPSPTPPQLPAHQQSRGLRRMHFQSTTGSSNGLQIQQYPQSTLCREQPPARVNRTGSLPWSQWPPHVRRTHM